MATYSEALWQETLGGLPAYKSDIVMNKYLGAGTIWVPNEDDDNRVFNSSLSYNKGSWVPHMLRHILGDRIFFAASRPFRAIWGGTTTGRTSRRDGVMGVREFTSFYSGSMASTTRARRPLQHAGGWRR